MVHSVMPNVQVKGLALASPSEHGERLEPFVSTPAMRSFKNTAILLFYCYAVKLKNRAKFIVTMPLTNRVFERASMVKAAVQ